MSLNNVATLFIVATPIGNLSEVSSRTIEVLNSVDIIACEDTRNTFKLLKHFNIHTKTITYHNFNEKDSTKGVIKLLEEGKDVALVSDAGYPLISDPGYLLVNEVIENGFNVTTISGPNAALNALVASGLETNHYMFFGFLNAKSSQARKQLEELKHFPYTVIFYEAPHRIEKTIKNMYEILGDRKVVIARELTKLHEQYYRGTLKELMNLTDLKGEIVVVVEGNKVDKEEVDESLLIEEVDVLVKKGFKTKQAINQVSERYKISKNSLYNAYLKHKA